MTYYPEQTSPANDATPWRRGRPGADDRQTSFLFWLTMLALGCVTLVGMAWGASNVLAQKGSEKLLRVDLLLPKLKSIHWERKAGAFHMSEPAQSAKASPKDRDPIVPHVPPPGFGHSSAMVTETPHHSAAPETRKPMTAPPEGVLLPIVETCDEPVVYLNPCTPQRGDSPMMRNWKTLTMYSLLTAAAATLAPPPLLMADDKEATDKLSKEVQALTRSVDALVARISDLEKKSPEFGKADLTRIIRAELKSIDEGVTELSTELKTVKRRVDGLKDDVSALKEDQTKQKQQIENLAEQVNKLNNKLVTSNA
ncbi:MAG: hypothetical protein LV481_11420, partial [Methylacidiphilales bacterium]|nr:hypothetical protein [Candidatus Methylacidiphilales bacterium]